MFPMILSDAAEIAMRVTMMMSCGTSMFSMYCSNWWRC